MRNSPREPIPNPLLHKGPRSWEMRVFDALYRYGRYILPVVAGAGMLLYFQAPTEIFPSETDRHKFLEQIGENPQKPVILLVSEWCEKCRDIEQWMAREGVGCTSLDVEKTPGGTELYKRVEEKVYSNAVPQIILDRHLVNERDLGEFVKEFKKKKPSTPAATETRG